MCFAAPNSRQRRTTPRLLRITEDEPRDFHSPSSAAAQCDRRSYRHPLSLKQLRQSYDLLLMKVLSLLQDTDQKLASAIVTSREAIWGLLSDQKKFDAPEI